MEKQSKFLKYYKNEGKTQTNIERNLTKKKERQSNRHITFISNRNITVLEEEPKKETNKCKTRREKLLEWKEEKKKKEEAEKLKQKPIFKVCRCPSTFQETKIDLTKKKKNQFKDVHSKINTNLRKDNKILDSNYQFKVPNLPPKQKKELNIPKSSIVTRGKLKRMNAIDLQVFPSTQVSLKNESFFSQEVLSSTLLENASTENKKDGKYFEQLLDSEIERLESICESWTNYITMKSQLPIEIKDEIECTICQTRLLIKNKFEQFRNLTRGTGDKLITSDDLQGFWDMMYIQVENINTRFTKLSERKEKDWVDELPLKNDNTNSKNSGPVKLQKKGQASSGIRQAIADARKKMREMKLKQDSNELQTDNIEKEQDNTNLQSKFVQSSGIKDLLKCSKELPSTKNTVVFDAGFFSVISPHTVKSPRTSTRPSISVGLSENKIKVSSPGLYMLNATRTAKLTEAEIGGDTPKISICETPKEQKRVLRSSRLLLKSGNSEEII